MCKCIHTTFVFKKLKSTFKPKKLLAEANGNNLKYKGTEKEEAESELRRILDFSIYEMTPIITTVLGLGTDPLSEYLFNRKT